LSDGEKATAIWRGKLAPELVLPDEERRHVEGMRDRQQGTDGHAERRGPGNGEPAPSREADAGEYRPTATTTELIAIAPRRELGTQWRTDAYQLGPITQTGEADLVGTHTYPRVAKGALGLLDGLPSRFEWGEVPPLARPAHDPQAPIARVEGETPPDGQRLDRFVRAE
jgi:hypothetical protein